MKKYYKHTRYNGLYKVDWDTRLYKYASHVDRQFGKWYALDPKYHQDQPMFKTEITEITEEEAFLWLL